MKNRIANRPAMNETTKPVKMTRTGSGAAAKLAMPCWTTVPVACAQDRRACQQEREARRFLALEPRPHACRDRKTAARTAREQAADLAQPDEKCLRPRQAGCTG